MQTQSGGSTQKQVFLGGSCNPTTWRKDVAMPRLTERGVAFYNPQVDEWHAGLVAIEAEAKKVSRVLLFVIDSQTRAIASMQEAAEYISSGRKVILVVNDITDGTIVAGQTITGRELKDLNNARTYLRDIAKRHGCTIYPDIESAVDAAAQAVTITADDSKTTTSGAPLRHGEYAQAPKHIPNGKGEPFKTELVISRDPDGSTVKMNWWHAPDDDRAPHNHPWDFKSTVLHGSLTETRYTPDGSQPGYYNVSTHTYKAGDTYECSKDSFHVVTAVAQGTVTRMDCGPARPDNEWGYIEITPAGSQVSGVYKRAQKDPDFMSRFTALNPFLAKKA